MVGLPLKTLFQVAQALQRGFQKKGSKLPVEMGTNQAQYGGEGKVNISQAWSTAMKCDHGWEMWVYIFFSKLK